MSRDRTVNFSAKIGNAIYYSKGLSYRQKMVADLMLGKKKKLKQRYGAREQILANEVKNAYFYTLGGSGRRLKIPVLIR